MSTLTSSISLAVALVLLVPAVWSDLRTRRIPNVLTLGGAVLGLLLQAALGGLEGLGSAATGWAVGFMLLLPGYLLGFTGAGDVKLLAAVGTFLGPQGVLVAGAASLAAGALLGIATVALSGGLQGLQSPWQRYGTMMRCLFTTGRVAYIRPAPGEVMGQRFPFALAIALGAVFAVAWALMVG
jgi:prepilin peptidase CpaA